MSPNVKRIIQIKQIDYSTSQFFYVCSDRRFGTKSKLNNRSYTDLGKIHLFVVIAKKVIK